MLTINTVGPTLMRHGSDELKRFFLPRILKGEIHFSNVQCVNADLLVGIYKKVSPGLCFCHPAFGDGSRGIEHVSCVKDEDWQPFVFQAVDIRCFLGQTAKLV
jgi:hypothetical protein